jgi:hypothetical protein
MSTAESGHDISGFRLTVSLAKSIFTAGEQVWMTVEFRNVSGRELPYGAQAKDFDYVMDCRFAHGEPVPLTLFGQRTAANRGEGRYISSTLAADQHLTAEVLVSRHLDLTVADRYTLRVTREVFPSQGAGQPRVVSNTCSFRIIEA